MVVIESIDKMIEWSQNERTKGNKIAFVPTMGYFHRGHLALMEMASHLGDKVVVSIFVNPTQFGPNEDLDKYPRDLKRDIDLAKSVGVDCIFFPNSKYMYPEGFQTWIEVEGVSKGLCGDKRPGHFRGVATVVLKLFNIVQPHVAVFGQKDFQQLKVIERMVQDLNLPVKIKSHPVVREKDGLAMSSRNTYLSSDERKSALCLFKALELAKKLHQTGIKNAKEIKKEMEKLIHSTPNTRIDYIFIGDSTTLKETEDCPSGTLIALAVWVGNTRLIDNTIL
ncbi:pantoate--beta-alanine ligase [Dissulfuribacter thermophilus]|uniref:pantoate--beta-alanine ligase n=1 Tax=Dissulfuribacter thermophilus TaxID=1156395 RepID=UPI000830C0F8